MLTAMDYKTVPVEQKARCSSAGLKCTVTGNLIAYYNPIMSHLLM